MPIFYRFRDNCDFRLTWKTHIPAHILGFFGIFDPHIITFYNSNPQKAHVLSDPRLLSHFACKSDAPFGLGVNSRKNNKTKKSHNLATSPPRRGATARPIFTKFGSFGLWPDVINCAKSQVSIFHRVRLARGSILGFQHYFDCRL